MSEECQNLFVATHFIGVALSIVLLAIQLRCGCAKSQAALGIERNVRCIVQLHVHHHDACVGPVCALMASNRVLADIKPGSSSLALAGCTPGSEAPQPTCAVLLPQNIEHLLLLLQAPEFFSFRLKFALRYRWLSLVLV
jgi:hypothetical protein